MKKSKLYTLVTILFIVVLNSCSDDFLDRASTNQPQDKDVFTSFVTTDQVINNLYRRTKGIYTYLGGHLLSSATDESKDASSWMASMRFNNGSYSGNDNPMGNTWRDNYVAIRQANSILEGIKMYNTPDDANNPGFLENRIGEVYFLRAWFLSELVRQFGGVILITETMSQSDEAALNKPRSSYDECVEQIIKDCDEAIKRVKYTSPDNEFGRVTKGTCLALKSRMLLYSASPLWAEAGKKGASGDISDNRTASDLTKWKKAANAAKELIDLKNENGELLYRLESTLQGRQNMFKTGIFQSPEVIWVRMRDANEGSDRYLFPYGYGGWSGGAPTQNVVEDYEMKNGLAIDDPNSGFDPNNPYVGRDPRFYTDILYNGAEFKRRKVETFEGGKDELSTKTDHTRTGYYLRKLVDENITPGQGSGRTIHGIQFRLAEIYLNYVEALNECEPNNPDILVYLNKIRQRAGQALVAEGLSQSQMREKIRNERRIELSFENHRFWDVRRWKIAQDVEQEIYGLRSYIDKSQASGFRYERFKVEDRPWRNAMYVMPITTDETLRNTNLKQNEGW